ncbi:UDP-N-acetylmuramate dehydrogenase [Marinomonas mediterranea]|jgi:UDP-N-acetylenolpyruvoylglucosamine reductase|uniref:UDP-N-acetylenolpyruvoylglucosamine reductase n=1 Tax=Marinomonas mediterranea (strain ATCC 700492 / JCM 21426 / NBRC 103028 / MMB-1) TaxID=717774 RepID=F2K3A2_MARM1|nr:UDP-N-acetylmuramate dehydrogenase [Marinomonas mediterranea]ADZ91244.1 UDP-N-acetylenolpyruvoylglucosamine reductase [Marinomonas mediterranea MMB-1]WCN13300.1 UDP-N-acetylmuramate dehydrogenase [Marinomonas mediterranea]WCN17368.1 UDP-N-acetylmuramate dehydrogenase [Marinomonas mediterranea MMB-1]
MPHIYSNISLKPYNTFAFDYAAERFAVADTIDALIFLVQFAKKECLDVTVIGGGSNLLIHGNIKGLVILNRIMGREYSQNAADVDVVFGAGEVWDECVEDSVSRGFGGIENLGLIPGTCGAAPVQNIGAYGVEIKDVLMSVEALNRESMKIETINAYQCGFAYRESHFKRKWSSKYIITRIHLRLSSLSELKLGYGGLAKVLSESSGFDDVYHKVCDIRRSKLPNPVDIPNSGSFFKNPVVSEATRERLVAEFEDLVSFKVEGGWKLAAGWLNEKAGWKGVKVGNVGVYEKQALVLVNLGDEKATELRRLEKTIIQSVHDMFGVTLEREPVLLGDSP